MDKRRRNFYISGAFVLAAGLFAHLAWITYQYRFSVFAAVTASILFITGVIIFAINFRE